VTAQADDDDLFPEFSSIEEELEFELFFLRDQLLGKMRKPPDAAMRKKLESVFQVTGGWYKFFLMRRRGRRKQFTEGVTEVRAAIAKGDSVAAALYTLRLMQGFMGTVSEFETSQLYELAFSSKTARSNKQRQTRSDQEIRAAIAAAPTMEAAAEMLGMTRQAISKRIPAETRALQRTRRKLQ
jgi:hypothetical protein